MGYYAKVGDDLVRLVHLVLPHAARTRRSRGSPPSPSSPWASGSSAAARSLAKIALLLPFLRRRYLRSASYCSRDDRELSSVSLTIRPVVLSLSRARTDLCGVP